jgi:hypothetical protein
MAHDGIAKVQHYVPHFLLKRWGTGKKDHVHAFEKASGRTWAAKARSLARESRFYDLEIGGQTLSLEPRLANLEAETSGSFRRLVEAESFASIAPEDTGRIAIFLSVQFVRTPGFREMFRCITNDMSEWLRSSAGEDEEAVAQIERMVGEAGSDDHVRLQVAKMIVDAPEEFSQHFLAKDWMLLRAPEGHPFLIGDHPVVMQNQTEHHPFWGNIGLAVRGIEIYMPVSPMLTLAMFCKSHFEAIKDSVLEAEAIAATVGLPPLIDPYVRAFIDAARTGSSLSCAPPNVENLNSLQIKYAERHVFSSDGDFELVRRMIETDAKYVHGPRATMGQKSERAGASRIRSAMSRSQ